MKQPNFDKVLHNGIFNKLLDRGIPVSFIQLLRYWYSNQTLAR